MKYYLYTYYDNTFGWKHTKLLEFVSPSSLVHIDAKFEAVTGKKLIKSPFISVTIQPI